MSLAALALQLLNGLVDASSMFLVAAGLSIIFGVTRVVNFAHGSLFMLGVYLAYSLCRALGTGDFAFWGGVLAAALFVGLIGAVIEMTLLRRIYHAPELFQLLATFALVLIIKDVTLYLWGPDDLFAARAPHLGGAIELLGRRFPEYDLVLIACGPLILGALWLILHRTRLGILIRAATQDREMVAALGVNQAWLFTGVFALGSFLAGLGGALQGPRMPASLGLDLETISTAFVVVVVGGMGSLPGAFLAALLIGEIKALCVGLGTVTFAGQDFALSKLTLVAEFLVMAVILVARPYGLLGRALAPIRASSRGVTVLPMSGRRGWIAGSVLILGLLCVPLLARWYPYITVLSIEILIAVLFAASLHFLVGPGGMHSFGHAAYFGLGAYGAALFLKLLSLPMEVALLLGPVLAGLGALVFGWFSVRLSGIYLAMLTLAFAQISWSIVYQWDGVTGGSNGLVGIWPAAWLASSVRYYYLTLILVALGVAFLRRVLFSPFGYALRAGRDSPLRAEAIGINVRGVQWAAFVLASLAAGLAGALYAFSKGSISPEVLYVNRSIDGLVMVLLGGVETLAGPWIGAALFTWLSDTAARVTDYWRFWLGITILILVLVFPMGIAGFGRRLFELQTKRGRAKAIDGGHIEGASRSQDTTAPDSVLPAAVTERVGP
ncbi:MAG: ABC transporter permease [Burkholderiaceae bacterium]|jgi:branched-chain amino acid transport system permease protein